MYTKVCSLHNNILYVDAIVLTFVFIEATCFDPFFIASGVGLSPLFLATVLHKTYGYFKNNIFRNKTLCSQAEFTDTSEESFASILRVENWVERGSKETVTSTFIQNVGELARYNASHSRRQQSSETPPWASRVLCQGYSFGLCPPC
jgi:hypothetical protein